MILIKFVALHNPLFLGGRNLSATLDSSRTTGLDILYDDEHSRLYVWYNGGVAIIPETNVSHMWPTDVTLFDSLRPAPKPIPAPEPPKNGRFGKIVAQVSNPTTHVQNGPGAGKVNDRT